MCAAVLVSSSPPDSEAWLFIAFHLPFSMGQGSLALHVLSHVVLGPLSDVTHLTQTWKITICWIRGPACATAPRLVVIPASSAWAQTLSPRMPRIKLRTTRYVHFHGRQGRATEIQLRAISQVQPFRSYKFPPKRPEKAKYIDALRGEEDRRTISHAAARCARQYSR